MSWTRCISRSMSAVTSSAKLPCSSSAQYVGSEQVIGVGHDAALRRHDERCESGVAGVHSRSWCPIVLGGLADRRRVRWSRRLGCDASSVASGGSRRVRAARRRQQRIARVEHDLTNEQWLALQAAWGGCAYCGITDTPLQR
jgi:hypothetical protein